MQKPIECLDLSQFYLQNKTYFIRIATLRVGNEFAEDLVHDTFIKVIEHLDSFKGKCTLKTWVTTILMNMCIMHIRKAKNRVTEELVGIHAIPVQNNDYEVEDKLLDSLLANSVLSNGERKALTSFMLHNNWNHTNRSMGYRGIKKLKKICKNLNLA